jgi:hemin uptake protein HemP
MQAEFERPSQPPLSHPVSPGQPPSLPSNIQGEQLFKGRQEILIDHNGDTYRLRITRNGKLILTK